MPRRFVLCDVFADQPFAGNPLAVFLDAGDISDQTMGALAREFGWSEITFVIPRREGWHPRVRIWTPHGELPFAGHPVVGTAVVLAVEGQIQPGWSLLELGTGPVPVEVSEARPDGGTATMTQQAPAFGATFNDRGRLAMALGLRLDDLASDLPAQVVSTGSEHFMVPVRSLEALGRARGVPELLPDLLSEIGVRWAYLFTVDTPGTVAAARARLVAAGREDAATGSAGGSLGAYLVHYRLHRAGALEIEQGVEMGRPSKIQLDVPFEAGALGPVRVTGQVHIWGRGTCERLIP